MNGEDAVCIDDILQFQNDVVNFGNQWEYIWFQLHLNNAA